MTVNRGTAEPRIGSGAIWALVGRGLGVLATALMVIVLPKFLTKEQFGAFSLISVLTMFASVIGTLGLNDANVRLLAEAAALRDSVRLRYIIRTGLRLTLVLALLSGIMVSAWLVTQRPKIVELSSPTILFCAVLFSVVLLALQLVSAESLRGLHDLRIASMMSGGGSGGPVTTLLFVGIVSLVYFGTSPEFRAPDERISLTEVLSSFLAALVITLPLSFYFLQRAKNRSIAMMGAADHTLATPRLADMTSVAIPLMFTHLLIFFIMNGDLWILEHYCELETVGLYAAARRLMLAVSIPYQIAIQATMSAIPDLAVRGELKKLEVLLRRAAMISAVISVAIGAVLLLMPELVLATVFNSSYSSAAPIVVVLCLGNLIVTLCGNANHALIMTGKHFYGLVVYGIAAVVLAVGGPIAAQAYGAVGVAVVASACVAFQSISAWLLAKRYVGVWTHPGWPRLVNDEHPESTNEAGSDISAAKSLDPLAKEISTSTMTLGG